MLQVASNDDDHQPSVRHVIGDSQTRRAPPPTRQLANWARRRRAYAEQNRRCFHSELKCVVADSTSRTRFSRLRRINFIARAHAQHADLGNFNLVLARILLVEAYERPVIGRSREFE